MKLHSKEVSYFSLYYKHVEFFYNRLPLLLFINLILNQWMNSQYSHVSWAHFEYENNNFIKIYGLFFKWLAKFVGLASWIEIKNVVV